MVSLIGLGSSADIIIQEISIPEFVESGERIDIYVTIENIEWSGNVMIKLESEALTISPQQKNEIIEGTKGVKFSIFPHSKEGIHELKVEVCDTPQFHSAYCVEETKSFAIVKESLEKGKSNSYLKIIIIVLAILVIIFGALYLTKKDKK